MLIFRRCQLVFLGFCLASCRGGSPQSVEFSKMVDGIKYRVVLDPDSRQGRFFLSSDRFEPVLIDKYRYNYGFMLLHSGQALVFPDPAINVRGPEGNEWVVLTKGDEISWSLDFAPSSGSGFPTAGEVMRLKYSIGANRAPNDLKKHAPVLRLESLDLTKVSSP